LDRNAVLQRNSRFRANADLPPNGTEIRICKIDAMIEYHPQDEEEFELPSPRLEYMARFTVDLVAPVWELGVTSDLGRRRVIPITSGSFAGPLLSGEILNNAADWQILTADRTAIIDTRYLLKLDDGSLAYLQTRGYRDR
jgi:hypothetical protein